MNTANKFAAAVAATLAITSTTAHADSNLGAFAVGAAVGAIVNHQVGKNQRAKQQRSYSNSYTRQQNREVQAALNSFGFNAGTVDGQLGQRSRGAIANYQVYMGYQATGYLDNYQRSQLIGAHQRLQAGGGAAYPQVVANEGTRGLLKAFADPNYANKYRSDGTGTQQAGVYNNQGTVDRSHSTTTQVAAGQQQPLAFAPLAPLNNTPVISMASHCKTVVGLDQNGQTVVLVSNVNDPEQALAEQFCEARAFAMTQGDQLAAQSGQSNAQLTTACGQIAEAMKPASDLIAGGNAQPVADQARQIASSIFQGNMDTAAGYGQICLGLGYKLDDAAMALGAATTLLAAGQTPYAEVMGHHTRWGFGTAASAAASTSWYRTALTSMDQGAQPVFVPGKASERNAIIKASIAAPAGNAVAPLQASGTLPALNLGNN